MAVVGREVEEMYKCPICGDQLRFIEKHNQWWCDKCKIYNPQPIQTPLKSNSMSKKKAIAFVIVLVIIVASVRYILRDDSDLTPINPNDPGFYDEYPTTPDYIQYVMTESDTLLWGNFTHDYLIYTSLFAVQISPTIQDLADGLKETYPDDMIQQAKAAFDFVVDEISPLEYWIMFL